MLIRLFACAVVVYAAHVDSQSQLGTYAYIDRQTQQCQASSSKPQRRPNATTYRRVDAGVSAACNIICAPALLAERARPPTTWSHHTLRRQTLDNHTLLGLQRQQQRTKHFLRQINFMLYQVKQGIIKLEHLLTENHHVDAHTKALGPTELSDHMDHMQGPTKRRRI